MIHIFKQKYHNLFFTVKMLILYIYICYTIGLNQFKVGDNINERNKSVYHQLTINKDTT